jgi:hypothetical protein
MNKLVFTLIIYLINFQLSSMIFQCKNEKLQDVSIAVPLDIIELILHKIANPNSYEELMELIKWKRISKTFNKIANQIYTKKLNQQTEQVKIFFKEDWNGNGPKGDLYFATAIAHNLLFWMHNHLKKQNYLIDKLVYHNVYPLHIAALWDAAESSKFLIAAKAKTNVLDTAYQRTPLIFAIESNHNKAAKILIDAEFAKQAKTYFDPLKWQGLKEVASNFNADIMPEIDKIIDIIKK